MGRHDLLCIGFVAVCFSFKLFAYHWRYLYQRSKIPPDGFDYSVENVGDTIFSMMMNLRIKRFGMVGHSMGAVLALHIAYKHPDNIRKVVVMDSPVFGPPHKLLLTYPLMGHLAEYCLGRLIIKKYIRSMYYDSSKINAGLIEEDMKSYCRNGFWLTLSKYFKEIFSSQFITMKNNYPNFETDTLILTSDPTHVSACLYIGT